MSDVFDRPGGCLIVLVGASGAGKDSILKGARKVLSDSSDVQFARRVITRAAHASSENHQPATAKEFQTWLKDGRFAVHWQANGLSYALPIDTRQSVIDGNIVVANGSRGALTAIRQNYPRVQIVHITASPDVVKYRLQQRSRENSDVIDQRMQRHLSMPPPGHDSLVIDNSGELAASVDALVSIIRAIAKNSDQ